MCSYLVLHLVSYLKYCVRTVGHVLQKELVVAYGGKVFSLCWDVRARDQEYLVSCGPEGEVVCYVIPNDHF